jgi:hypothetical protein
MDEMAAIHQRLETAALQRGFLASLWQEFAELQREKSRMERSKFNGSDNCFNPRITRKF